MSTVFKLSDEFISEYAQSEVKWGPMGEFTYLRTYSRLKEDGTKEQWFETVRRVVEGAFSTQKKHCESLKLVWNNTKAQKSAKTMYDKIFNFKFLPPGRGLWMMGTQFVEEKGSAALNNCGFVSTDDIQTRGSLAFSWTMDALMLGVGIGFDTKGAGKITIKHPKPDGVFVIPDSREGWVESLQKLLDGFILGQPLSEFDYSLIRPYGTPINGFGGVASGPDPLKMMHESINALLQIRIGQKIKSTDIVDLMNMIGKCVVAGNVRRSAEIAIGEWDDTEYTTMKDYNLHPEELQSHRWASNNSVFADVGKTDYSKIANSIALNGEPGVVWLENMREFSRMNGVSDWKDEAVKGLNPCAEQSLETMELCCLVETFPSLHDSVEEYIDTLKYAYMYAKTVTLIPTHWPETNAVLLKNRRIGLSQSGIIDAFAKHGRDVMINEWNMKAYAVVQKYDQVYSDWFCVPRSRKTTSIKPSGSVSLLAGVSPGIHYPHAEYYIRRIRVATESPLVNIMTMAGYEVCFEVSGDEEERKKTSIIHFPIHEKNFEKKKDDVSIWEQVKNAVDYQRTWADNSVSITVTFKETEAHDIASVLYCFERELKAISFLPISKHGYDKAPYEEITKEKYDEMMSKITKPYFGSIFEGPSGSKYCDGDSCDVPEIKK
jgi:adenosylcobalamin-dependent ribonucleoside-triphosphate reductase